MSFMTFFRCGKVASSDYFRNMEQNAPLSCTTKELDAPTTTEACLNANFVIKRSRIAMGISFVRKIQGNYKIEYILFGMDVS